tara:strand:- start:17 stop:745 length:729 start_codon:yes stop_codon:yes gene_type:complete
MGKLTWINDNLDSARLDFNNPISTQLVANSLKKVIRFYKKDRDVIDDKYISLIKEEITCSDWFIIARELNISIRYSTSRFDDHINAHSAGCGLIVVSNSALYKRLYDCIVFMLITNRNTESIINDMVEINLENEAYNNGFGSVSSMVKAINDGLYKWKVNKVYNLTIENNSEGNLRSTYTNRSKFYKFNCNGKQIIIETPDAWSFPSISLMVKESRHLNRHVDTYELERAASALKYRTYNDR